MKIFILIIFIFSTVYSVIGQLDLDQSFPTRYDSLTLNGIQYLKVENFKKASKKLKHAIKKDIINPAGCYYLGISMNNTWRSNHPKQNKTIHVFTAAIQHDRNNPKYFFRRGLCYHGKGNHRLALIDFDRAIELNPSIPEYYFYRATARLSLTAYEHDSTFLSCSSLNDLLTFDSIINKSSTIDKSVTKDFISWSIYHKIIAYQILGDSIKVKSLKLKYESIDKRKDNDYILSYGWPQYFSGEPAGREPVTVIFPVGIHPFDFRVNIRKKNTCNNI